MISSMLVHAAIRCDRKVRLMTNSQRPGDEELEIDRPRLLFRRDWHVVEARRSRDQGTSLAEVRKVSIS